MIKQILGAESLQAGFTLIELLVVVLIIGILAAVALPQYEVAVEKSRFARVMANVKSIKNSAELYYLANDVYPPDIVDGLDLADIQGCTSVGQGQLHCGKEWYDLIYYAADQAAGLTRPYGEYMNAYVLWFDHSATPGQAECLAMPDNQTAQKVCRSMGGTQSGSVAGWEKYILP